MRRAALLTPLLVLGFACSDDPGTFAPGGQYTPMVLDFGEVPTTSERTMNIEVTSNGGAPLRVLGVTLAGDEAIFSWTVASELTGGLAPGRTATIEVTYTPCADWMADPTACSTGPQAATLIVTDDSGAAERRIELTGVAVQPAEAFVKCPAQPGMCNQPDIELLQCGALQFTPDDFGGSCELFVEITAGLRAGATGPLEILNANVAVRNIEDTNPLLVTGEEIGLTVLDELPLVIPAGESARLRLLAENLPPGVWAGIPSAGGGLRLITNDPSNREIAVQITATATPMNLQAFPPGPYVFPAEMGRHEMSIQMQNSGGPGAIAAIEVSSPLLSWSSPDPIIGPILPFERRRLDIAVDLPDDMNRSLELRIVTVGQGTLTMRIQIGNQAPAGCAVTPAELQFTTAGGSATGVVTVSPSGFGDCHLQTIDITSPAGTDDFTVDLAECAALPCTLDRQLVPGTSFDIPIVYANNDLSGNDIAQLEVTTDDPGLPTQLVVLTGNDDVCLPPVPVIMRTNEMACIGMPVEITASASNPGGRSGQMATIVDYRWTVSFGEQVLFVPPNTETTLFTPSQAQGLIVALELENSCGATSSAPATEMVNVAPTCN